MTTSLDDLISAVDGERMVGTVAALADDRFTGRRTGTPGSTAARNWLAGQLRDLGADVDMEAFAVYAVPDIYAAVQARWQDDTAPRPLAFGRDVAVHLASTDQPGVLRGELGVAGTVDPAGRWLLVPAGMPLSGAYQHAERALGLLVGRNTDADGWHYTMLAGPTPGPLPVLTLGPATHAAMLERHGWFDANAPIRRADVRAANLHGRWGTGTDLLLTAHYDGVGDLPGLRQPAASDNASGVAVVLEAVRILGPVLPGGLSIALLDAEEVGALGSAHHAGQLTKATAAPSVINVDGVARLERAAAVEAGGPAHALLAVLDQAGRHTGLPLTAGPVASDNRRYAAAGFAAAGIGAGMGGYHSPADTPDRVDSATLVAVCRFVVAIAWLAATTSPRLSSLIGD